ncbi:hypothetical protein OCOL_001810 [Ordospora colligata]
MIMTDCRDSNIIGYNDDQRKEHQKMANKRLDKPNTVDNLKTAIKSQEEEEEIRQKQEGNTIKINDMLEKLANCKKEENPDFMPEEYDAAIKYVPYVLDNDKIRMFYQKHNKKGMDMLNKCREWIKDLQSLALNTSDNIEYNEKQLKENKLIEFITNKFGEIKTLNSNYENNENNNLINQKAKETFNNVKNKIKDIYEECSNTNPPITLLIKYNKDIMDFVQELQKKIFDEKQKKYDLLCERCISLKKPPIHTKKQKVKLNNELKSNLKEKKELEELEKEYLDKHMKTSDDIIELCNKIENLIRYNLIKKILIIEKLIIFKEIDKEVDNQIKKNCNQSKETKNKGSIVVVNTITYNQCKKIIENVALIMYQNIFDAHKNMITEENKEIINQNISANISYFDDIIKVSDEDKKSNIVLNKANVRNGMIFYILFVLTYVFKIMVNQKIKDNQTPAASPVSEAISAA